MKIKGDKIKFLRSVGIFSFAEVFASAIFYCGNHASAQIIPDRTLGESPSSITPNINIKGLPADRIDGGAIRNANLFHSFQEFNVKESGRVYFANPAGITNIFTRVTGNNISQILGTLGVDGPANLFFLNPNGIIFGRNARLDIAGSFVASTANSVIFADNTRFATNASNTTPLLTITAPIGLQLADSPGKILVQGNGRGIRNQDSPVIDTNEALRVPTNQTLALVGGDVTFEGGTLKTAGGRIEIGSVAAGTVSLNPVAKGFSLGYEGISNFQDIQLLKATTVDASGLSGGEIQIRGKRITLQGGSQIETTSLNTAPGGKLTVIASELVELSGTTADNPQDNRRNPTSFATDNRATGNIPGELTINTQRLIVRDGGRISASSINGVGGNITVNASDVELIGTFTAMGGLRSSGLSVQTRGRGNAGKLTINTQNMTIQDGAELSASTFGAGDGGEIEINALNGVQVIGRSTNGELVSRIVAEVGANSREISRNGESIVPTGKGGNLKITTGQLSVTNGAIVTVTSRSESPNAQGAGELDVIARNIFLDNEGQISAASFSGQGGDIRLQLQELLLLRHKSRISTNAGNDRFGGDGGNIIINSPFIAAVPQENSDITANAFTGNGGRVDITANGVFGILPQQSTTLLSDITASSRFGIQGFVTINTPDVDPSRGLVELPANLVDASQKITQSCSARGKTAGRFIATGRGGLPLSPDEPLRGRAVITNWVNLPVATTNKITEEIPEPQRIVEAQGWIKSDRGDIMLVAQSQGIGNGEQDWGNNKIPVCR
ncbi:filamentous hemagglutinin outer membrane protein (plasmid) [Nostoc linckia NIES-25]|nr:filamentous hemagglutinin outer membrane protein [Nostoc linckia NIES-25]